MIAANRVIAIGERDIENVLEAVKQLQPHSDVPLALQSLADEGFTMVALTQSTLATVKAQMEYAGLKKFFSRTFSADEIKRYKPSPEPYQMVHRGCFAN
ncbi:MAG: HAD hydrolase-like protein [Candidatus Eremiobacteraeota bacterium]|nr:HAD hydrolase-like protein [Candidatus Eremiobacteraeota bacterium]